ncbi:MAG: hypothetical protein NTW87_31830, partial [Planctomycetota bacterium]|nr:hypothetical protein [Planctomycetota bacterium]
MRRCVLMPVVLAIAWTALSRGGSGAEEPLIRWGGGSSPNTVSTARDLPADPGNTEPLWELKLGTHQYSIPT